MNSLRRILQSLLAFTFLVLAVGGLSSCSFSEEEMKRRTQANLAKSKQLARKRAADYPAKQNAQRTPAFRLKLV